MADQKERIARKIADKLTPISDFLSDNSVVEVMLNEDGCIRVDRLKEGMSKTDIRLDRSYALLLMGAIADYNGMMVNASNPLLKASLPTGQRFQGMIEPVVSSPVFTIRCPRSVTFELDDYVSEKRMTAKMADMLRNAISGRKNVIVSGGTGSGKTTLTNAMLKELSTICPDDRIVVMEDTREINVTSHNTVFELATEKVTMCDLLAANLRMRPDRIILGEIRGPEALDLLKSWNTGHPGGISTVHANTALSALARFETLILEANGNLNISFIRSLVADAVDIVVHIQRHKRKGPILSEILAVTGLDLDGRYITKGLARNEEEEA